MQKTTTIKNHSVTIKIEQQEQQLIGKTTIFGPKLIDSGQRVHQVTEYDLVEQMDNLYFQMLTAAKSAISRAKSN